MGVVNDSASGKFDWKNVFWWIPTIANMRNVDQNNQTQINLQESAQAWNKEQSDIAWQRALEQWNRENEYNSPMAQMNRLREAGINPALAYSNGITNQAASSPDSPVPAPARAAPTQAYQMDETLMSQIDLMHAQAEDFRASAALKQSQQPYYLQLIETEKKKLEDFDSQIAKRKAEIEVLSEDKKLRIAQTADIKFQQVMASKRYMLDRKEIYSRIELYKKEGNAYAAAAARDLANAALTRQQLKLLVDTYGEQVLGIKMQTKISQVEFADLQGALERAGIKVDWETGSITVVPNKKTAIQSHPVYAYASAAAGLIGECFGVVLPVGRAGRAVKPLTQIKGYRAPGF